MARHQNISSVFLSTTPISADQTGHRSFVDRADYREKLIGELLRDDLLVVSGYSGIGKTTFINLVTAKKELARVNAPFTAVVSVPADSESNSSILSTLYDGIAKYTSGKRPERISPTSLAEIVHVNQLLLIIDGVNSLYSDSQASRELFNLCKTWTDIPRGAKAQSKVVLVASGLPSQVSHWLSEASSGKRLPRVQFSIPPWSSSDLSKITEIGSGRLGIAFESALEAWMAKVACGLPSTMTLLAALTARHANSGRDELFRDLALKVDLADLHGVLGEQSKFQEILIHDIRIETLGIPELLALFLLGMCGGRMWQHELISNLECLGFPRDDIAAQLEDLVISADCGGPTSLSIRELSSGTFAFLRLFYLSKLSGPDATGITRALNILNEAGVQIAGEDPYVSQDQQREVPEMFQSGRVISVLFLAADPADASRLRLGEEFREIQERLRLARLREQFRLELPQLSVRPQDICQALLDLQPQIVHFSGHGTSSGALCFENRIGEALPVQPEALGALFEQFANRVTCVFLNACYALTQAEAIAQHIEYVIGMTAEISDRAAIAFAIGFYQALGAGRTIEQAHKLGCVQIRLQGIPEYLTPILVKKAPMNVKTVLPGNAGLVNDNQAKDLSSRPVEDPDKAPTGL